MAVSGPFRQHAPKSVAAGTPVAHWLIGAASSAGTYGGLAYFGFAYGNWSLRARLNGTATSGAVQLLGTIAMSSSEANTALVALTTCDLTSNGVDFTVSTTTPRPINAVAPYVSVASSSATSIDVWIVASA